MHSIHNNIMTLLAFASSGPASTAPLTQAENRSALRSSPRVASVTLDGVERAKIITEQVNREGVGSAERHPVPAGINVACDVCQVVLDKLPSHHAHWHHLCAGTLHIVSDVLTASPN